jgi:hypothetical protein
LAERIYVKTFSIGSSSRSFLKNGGCHTIDAQRRFKSTFYCIENIEYESKSSISPRLLSQLHFTMIVHQPLHKMLALDELARKVLPLDEVSFNHEDDCSSVVSSMSEDNDAVVHLVVGKDLQSSSSSSSSSPVQQIVTTKTTRDRPRSIFSNYWKADSSPNIQVTPSSRCSSSDVPPHKVQARRTLMQQGPQYADIDPNKLFGLTAVADEVDEKDDSINTYERMLQRDEFHARSSCRLQPESLQTACDSTSRRPLWLYAIFGVESSSTNGAYRTASAPSLRRMEAHHNFAKRGVLSDTALMKSPKKSSLRRGRFSVSCGRSCAEESTITVPTSQKDSTLKETSRTTTTGVHCKHYNAVSFQPRVDVYVFQPPVETWAHKGWSNWFG